MTRRDHRPPGSLELQVQRGAEVIDEWRQPLQVLLQRLPQPGAGEDVVAERTQCDEVAVLEVLDEFEVRREAAWRAHQFFGSPEIVAAPECRRMRRRLPAAGIVEDELAQAALGRRFRMPQTGADEALARLQVDVEGRRLDLPPAGVEQACALPALVRSLVVGEARIAMQPEQR